MVAEQALQLESIGARLHSVFYSPPGTVARGVVVFCHPLFDEQKSACRPMVDAAREFTRNGLASLRFDLVGCGDSEGDLDAVKLADWRSNIRTAVEFAREKTVGPVGLLGLRLGGALALMAGEELAMLDFLVLWEPALDGRAYLQAALRKQKIRDMMVSGKPSETRRSREEQITQEGIIDFDGFPVGSALYREISAIDLGTTPKIFKGDLLIVQVAPLEQPSQSLRRFADTYRLTGKKELAAIRMPPFWNQVGVVDVSVLVRRTAAWLTSR